MRTLLVVVGLIVGLAAISMVALADDADEASEPEAKADSPLIVVDPGHGGANTGAPTADGELREKDFTLAVSTLLAAELRARGARVIMTRSTDEYLTLRQRTDIANRAGADVFISVHGNASPDHSRSGYETFLLSPAALDVDGRALRTRGEQRAGLSLPLSRLVDDVSRGRAHPRSAALARTIQDAVGKVRPSSPNRGVKQESMHVLLGANMPAVLVELGFVDHPVEGPELLAPKTQQRLAEALATALVPQAN